MPGFISLKVYNLLCPGKLPDFSTQMFSSIMYSCLSYAIHLPIYLISATLQDFSVITWKHVLFITSLILIFPALIPIAWLFIRKIEWVNNFLPHPTNSPWDYVFSQRNFYWLIVTLKDGTILGGKYGAGSFSSSYPEDPQIFISEQWLVDQEGFIRKVNDSSGIMILSKDIKTIEFFTLQELKQEIGESNDTRE
jgi:CBS domain containing-hemolysin-like protein